VVVRTRRQDEESAARADILRKKQEAAEVLARKAESLARVRRLASAQAQTRKEGAAAARDAAAALQQRVHETSVQKLAGKLDAKRAAIAAERARLAAEEKRVAFLQQQQAAGADIAEETVFRELRSGAERAALQRQQAALEETTVTVRTQARARAMELQHAARKQRAKRDMLRAYDGKVESLKSENRAVLAERQQRQQRIVTSRRAHEDELRAAHAASSYVPFAGGGTSMEQKLRTLACGGSLEPPGVGCAAL